MGHDDEFPDELDDATRDALSELWGDECYGYHEPGYVDSDDLKRLLPEAQKLVLLDIQRAQGQVALDMTGANDEG